MVNSAPSELVARVEALLADTVIEARRAGGGTRMPSAGRCRSPAGAGCSRRWRPGRRSLAGCAGSTRPTPGWAWRACRSWSGGRTTFDQPLLILEDLGQPLRSTRCARDSTSSPRPWRPAGSQDLEEREREELSGWSRVRDAPAEFLLLGLASERWLDRSIEALVASAADARLSGRSVVHMDVRSDNVCIVRGRAKLFDWHYVARGNALLDLAFWLPSLRAECGPAPEELLPRSEGFAALVSGALLIARAVRRSRTRSGYAKCS